jgi:RNA polymerase sigma-70 factor, ECF subfamily
MESPIPIWGKRSDRLVLSLRDGDGGEDRIDDRSGEGEFLRPSNPEALFRQSYRSIVQSLALVGGDLAAAEDATQEAFAEACVRWNRISRYDNPGAWVRRVAINKLRNAHRSRVRGAAAIERMASEIETPLPPSVAEPDLHGALRRLSYKQRLSTVLYYVEGLSTVEVAQAMGISQGSVSQHLNRARTALRAHLEGTA